MANVGAVLQAVTPFKSLFKHAHPEKKNPGPAAQQAHGLFADLETELVKHTGNNK